MDAIKTETIGEGKTAFVVKLFRDPDARNPRSEFDHFGTLTVRASPRYGHADKGARSFGVLREMVESGEFDGVLHFMESDQQGVSEACDFDDANIVIYADASCIRREFGAGLDARDKAKACLQAEGVEYRDWATGEVYGYVVENADGEQVSSCWGFYGEGGDYCWREAMDQAKYLHGKEVAAAADYAARC